MADLPGTREMSPDKGPSDTPRLAKDHLPNFQTTDRSKSICRFVLERTVYIFRWDWSRWWLHPLSLWPCSGCLLHWPATSCLSKELAAQRWVRTVYQERLKVLTQMRNTGQPINPQISHSKLLIPWCWNSLWTCRGLICCCWKWEAFYLFFHWEWYSVHSKSRREAEYPSDLFPLSSV